MPAIIAPCMQFFGYGVIRWSLLRRTLRGTEGFLQRDNASRVVLQWTLLQWTLADHRFQQDYSITLQQAPAMWRRQIVSRKREQACQPGRFIG